MMKITRLKSQTPITPYAASWDAPLGFSQWNESDKIDTIRNFLLEKEEEILKLPYNSDGNTGLKKDSITTRFGMYHVFDFSEECPELVDLLQWMRIQWMDFIKEDFTEYYPLHFTCWYNILRKGDKIDIHRHFTDHRGYLSGNMHLDDYEDSKTLYEHMEMVISCPNVKGGLTFFPGYVEHYVPVYNGDKPRVSLAFDLYIHMDGLQDHIKYLPFTS